MVNEEMKVVECTVEEFETHLNKLCELSWDLLDWKIDFPTRKILAIFLRNLSVESIDWIDRMDQTLDKLIDLRDEDIDED